jgi:uncharacterized protein YndB with AHSA1/START domain
MPVGDAAVEARTGKKWAEWFKILDAAGAKKMDHQEIVAVLTEKHKLPPWWRQMVAVGYEQTRGLRQKHQKPEGYEISSSKTLAAPVAAVFDAWENPKARQRWLGEAASVIRKATPDKSIRITWSDQKTSVEVGFYPKGDSKTQVAVQHSKLADAKAAERMKDYWGKKLERLKEFIEA